MSSNYRNSVERMTLLKLQTKLDREVCANCPFSNSPNNDECEGCSTFEELNRIGDWLNKDVQGHKPTALHEVKPGKVKFTREDYIALKQKGLSDAEAASCFKIANGTLDSWKKKNGIRSKDIVGVLV